MARSALIESLRSQATRDAQAVWESARAEAERRRAELATALEQERLRLDGEVSAEVARLEALGVAEAERKARETSAGAAAALAERLLQLARSELPQLCGPERAALFDALAGELPSCRWQSVRVNPADVDLAKKRFPDATVETDPDVSGGLEVAGEDGRIAVSNTLETRLAIAWPDLLPALIADLAGEQRAHGTAA